MCSRDCLNCPFPDCIDDTFTPSDYLDQVEEEKAAGVFQPEDECYFLIDLLAVARSERRRARHRVHMRERRREDKGRRDARKEKRSETV